jgi:hypothetical protein
MRVKHRSFPSVPAASLPPIIDQLLLSPMDHVSPEQGPPRPAQYAERRAVVRTQYAAASSPGDATPPGRWGLARGWGGGWPVGACAELLNMELVVRVKWIILWRFHKSGHLL